MEYLIIFAIIIILLIIGLLMRIVKGILKIFFLGSLIITIITGILCYSVYSDAIAFQQGWESAPKLFLLHDNNYLISGYMAEPNNEELPITPISKEIIKQYRESFSNEDYNTILGNNYKLFLIDFAAFNEVKEINFINTNLSLAQVKNLLESATPTKDFAKITTGMDLQINVNPNDDENFRSSVFAILFATAVTDQGPLYIVQKVKDNTIQVYPETALFKTIKLIPISFIKHAFSQVAETSKEGITAAASVVDDLIDEHKGDIIDILR